MSLSTKIPSILLSRIQKLRSLSEPQIVQALRTPFLLRLVERLQQQVRLFGVGRPAERAYWRIRLEGTYSGSGLPEHSDDPSVISWMGDPPPSWSGADYVAGVQLRANMLPTRGGLHNKRVPFDAKRCRAGCNRSETLSHVLQHCPITHYERIRRHDHAVGLLAGFAARRGWDVEVEPCIRGTDGVLRKPDLIFSKGDQTIVADVGINWETPLRLDTHYQHKVSTYSVPPFASALVRRYPAAALRVLAFVLGARGTWCHSNDVLVRALGLSRSECSRLVAGAIMGGILIHKSFSRLVWDRRAPPDRL